MGEVCLKYHTSFVPTFPLPIRSLLNIQYFGKGKDIKPLCRMPNLGQWKAKLRRSSTNGRASPLSKCSCWEHPHYHTADHSKRDQRAFYAQGTFYAPSRCIWDLYLLFALRVISGVLRYSYRFVGKPSPWN